MTPDALCQDASQVSEHTILRLSMCEMMHFKGNILLQGKFFSSIAVFLLPLQKVSYDWSQVHSRQSQYSSSFTLVNNKGGSTVSVFLTSWWETNLINVLIIDISTVTLKDRSLNLAIHSGMGFISKKTSWSLFHSSPLDKITEWLNLEEKKNTFNNSVKGVEDPVTSI